MRIVCVLKSGGIYTPEWVYRLRDNLAEHCDFDYTFVCYSNLELRDVETIPLRKNWPGWWSKLELFWETAHFPTLYLDLDCVVVKDLASLMPTRNGFWMCKNFGVSPGFNSSVMAWRGDYSFIPEIFDQDVSRYKKQFANGPDLGDQGFIQAAMMAASRSILTISPGAVRSFKWDVKQHGTQDAKVIAFHGKPKQNETAQKHEEWKWLWPTQ